MRATHCRQSRGCVPSHRGASVAAGFTFQIAKRAADWSILRPRPLDFLSWYASTVRGTPMGAIQQEEVAQPVHSSCSSQSSKQGAHTAVQPQRRGTRSATATGTSHRGLTQQFTNDSETQRIHTINSSSQNLKIDRVYPC